jgi:hypothetical protein
MRVILVGVSPCSAQPPGSYRPGSCLFEPPSIGHRSSVIGPATGDGMAGHVMGTQCASPFACLHSPISEWRAELNLHIDEVATRWGNAVAWRPIDASIEPQVSPRCTRQETGGSDVWAGRCSWWNEPARRDIRRRRFSLK